jgi:tetratricopeptide (TPR) repeat protein
MQVAERVYSQAQEQDDPTLMIWAYNVLAATLFFLGDFESARQYAMNGIQIWRSGGAPSHPEDVDTAVVGCLCYKAFSEWHFGEIASCHATIDEAISLAKELKDMVALAGALSWAASLGIAERNPDRVDRLTSDLIEVATRHNFVRWLAWGSIQRGWARSASGDTAEGIEWIEQGIRDYRATGSVALSLQYHLARKAEALHLADRIPEALETINEALALVERFEVRWWSAEMHRLRGVFLANMGVDEAQIEASFCEAIRIAKEQKSISLEKRAEATYAEYHRQKASTSGGRGFRLPL